jgi:hypothetical protein
LCVGTRQVFFGFWTKKEVIMPDSCDVIKKFTFGRLMSGKRFILIGDMEVMRFMRYFENKLENSQRAEEKNFPQLFLFLRNSGRMILLQ